MKRPFIILLIIWLSAGLHAQVSFENYFTDKTLRFDFMIAGNSEKAVIYPIGLKEEPFWGGPITNLLDPFNYGSLKYEIYDLISNTLIYSRGYCTLYQEWQTTAEAKKMERSFYEVATFPFPRNSVRFVLLQREPDGTFKTLFETSFDPGDYFILKEKPVNAITTKIIDSGDPHTCVDIVFIAEGYTALEMGQFREDVRNLAQTMTMESPFKEFKNNINVWAVEAISEESGTDVPREGIYKNTALNSSFSTFDLDRYLTTFDIKSVNDFAATVPHDNIVVLINSNRYGGGGVYNYYTGTTAGNILSQKVFVHEFGHGFAGLGDEYFTSDVTYENYYPLNVEPWEPNLTTLVNFDLKWKSLLDKDTPVPTPLDKKYLNQIGVFEGGGYSAKGVYRPEVDCRMKSNSDVGFCTVCSNAIKEMIGFYIK